MLSLEVQVAISWWWQERKSKDATWMVVTLMPFLFQILESLHLETRKLPFVSMSGATRQRIANSYSFYYGLFLSPRDYAVLRSILALLGDLANVTASLKRLPKTLELGSMISKLDKLASQYVVARNFFTHMDQALADFGVHGVNGPLKTTFGFEYEANTLGNMYLVWDNDTIYFPWNHKPNEIKMERKQFDPIFQVGRELYVAVFNNSISVHDTGHTPFNQVLPV